jgi:hypothetical protein
MNPALSTNLPRRQFLRGAGVALALPALETFAARDVPAPRRLVAINFELSFHPPNLVPEEAGRGYELPPYLQPLADLRDDFTFISGTSHPEVDGGHAASKSWLSGAPHPGAANFRNSISVDQVAARAIGLQTRFSYLALGGGSVSISPNGVSLPSNSWPASLYQQLFVEGRPEERARQIERLREGRSVLDTVRAASQRMKRRVSAQDRVKLDQYFTSVREAEQMLEKSEQWQNRPKPVVDGEAIRNIDDQNRIIERARLFYKVIHLALRTDSTRLVTFSVGDSGAVATLPGVSMNYHDLSHHGQDPEKLRQLAIIEGAHLEAFGDFLRGLRELREDDSSVLDRTMVLLGSHMHSGGHDNRNLHIILSGGGFRHGQHLAFDREQTEPLANLYVSMLQRLGIPTDRFASSTGTLKGLELFG